MHTLPKTEFLIVCALGAAGGVVVLYVVARCFCFLEQVVDRGVKVSIEIPAKRG